MRSLASFLAVFPSTPFARACRGPSREAVRSKEHGKKEKEGQFRLDVVYGDDNLEVTMLHQFNTIWSGGERGKNYALFSVPNITHPYAPDSVYAEVNINPYHKVQQLYLDDVEMLEKRVVKKRLRRNYVVDSIMMRKVSVTVPPCCCRRCAPGRANEMDIIFNCVP